MSVRLAFGCRSPTSMEGTWQDAYVVCVDNSGVVTCAMFYNNMDYVGNNSLEEGIAQYEKLLALGWVPMIKEDLQRTAGLTVSNSTITNMYYVKLYAKWGGVLRVLLVALAAATGVAIGYLLSELLYNYVF